MSGNQEPMRNQEMFNANKGTLSDFSMLYRNANLMGACDIDFIYERKGHVVIGEGKRMINEKVSIPVGQYIMLKTMYNSDVCTTLFIAAYEKCMPLKHFKHYIMNFREFMSNAVRMDKELPNGKTIKMMVVERPDFKQDGMTEKQMCQTVKKLCERID